MVPIPFNCDYKVPMFYMYTLYKETHGVSGGRGINVTVTTVYRWANGHPGILGNEDCVKCVYSAARSGFVSTCVWSTRGPCLCYLLPCLDWLGAQTLAASSVWNVTPIIVQLLYHYAQKRRRVVTFICGSHSHNCRFRTITN